DTHFTAEMETSLDAIADGKRDWQEVLGEFYTGFAPTLSAAKDAPRYKIPVEETDEICEVCGRNMVIKSGRFGRFLACPGFPECTNTKPLVVIMPGECPKCGGKILKREAKSKAKGKAYNFYACEKGKDACGFITFDVPTADHCPECGKTMFKKDGKGAHKAFCSNETCPAYVAPKVTQPKEETAEPSGTKKAPAKRKAATAKKKAPAKKKSTAKKTTGATK
ncbi:MAG: topoisomerase DNA-binding C4 zinc finger domain-containing protein, partial [Oscillospiraceae bacterium]|nr:topoisomerase DNA-binding C4 zinc finger domain-containing protein [Oscillospiraceae bacterium]